MSKAVFLVPHWSPSKIGFYRELFKALPEGLERIFVCNHTSFAQSAFRSEKIRLVRADKGQGLNRREILEHCNGASVLVLDGLSPLFFSGLVLDLGRAGIPVILRAAEEASGLNHLFLRPSDDSPPALAALVEKALRREAWTDQDSRRLANFCADVLRSVVVQDDEGQEACPAEDWTLKDVLYIFHDGYPESKNQRYYRQLDYLKKLHQGAIDVVYADFGRWVDWTKILREKERIPVASASTELFGIPGNSFHLGWLHRFFYPAMHIYSAIFSLLYFCRAAMSRSYRRCYANSVWSGFFAILLRKLGRVGQVIYEDLDYYPGFFEGQAFSAWVLDRMEKYVVRNADFVASVSLELKQLRLEQTGREVFYSPNGTDLELFSSAQNGPGKKGHTIIYTGSLDKWSGLDIFIHSLALIRGRVPDVRLVILGKEWKDNFYNDEIRPLIEQEGLSDCVDFIGLKPYSELPSYLAQARIGVIPNRLYDVRRYACPLKLFEYMSAGLPVVCSDLGDMGKIVKDRQVGIACQPGPQAFADAVIQLFERPDWADAMRLRAIEASASYDWTRIFEEEGRELEQLPAVRQKPSPAPPAELRALYWWGFRELGPVVGRLLGCLGYWRLFGSWSSKPSSALTKAYQKLFDRLGKLYRELAGTDLLDSSLFRYGGYTYAYPDVGSGIAGFAPEETPSIRPSVELDLLSLSGAAFVFNRGIELGKFDLASSCFEVVLTGVKIPEQLVLYLFDERLAQVGIPLHEYLVSQSDARRSYRVPFSSIHWGLAELFDGRLLYFVPVNSAELRGFEFCALARSHWRSGDKRAGFQVEKLKIGKLPEVIKLLRGNTADLR